MSREGRLLSPPIGLGLAVLSVSFAAPLFRLAEAPALTASFWRLAFAVAILLPFTRGAWGAWRKFDRKDMIAVVASGAALGFHFGIWVTSLDYTTVAASVTLVTLQAVWVAVGSHLILGERLSGRAWLGVFIATAGAIGVGAVDGLTAPDSQRALFGDALALLGGLGSAAYMIIGRRLRQRHDLVTYVAPVYFVAALSLLPFMFFMGQPLAAGIGAKSFILFVLLAAVPMLGGHTLVNWCMRYMPASTVATWILLEPVGAALIAWPLLGEVPHWGIAIAASAVVVGAWQTIRPNPSKEIALAVTPP